MINKKVKFAVIGAGSRGLYSYSPYVAKYPEKSQIVAVAEPKQFNREQMASQFSIEPSNVFKDWKELLALPKLADAVIIAVQDELHKEVAIAAANKGYHIMLEKPMAVTAADCLEICDAVKKNDVKLCVCHVLRYAPFFMKVKEVIDSGALGDVVSIQHTEGVGFWHQAHSYVRGNWRREDMSSFMLLAKSCHDMDVLNWWIGKKCKSVSSFGHLKHFKPENKPAKATDRCMTCPLADGECCYSAKTYYLDYFDKGNIDWPINVLISEFTREALVEALQTGPYGRCVYCCDNDVVDNQVVIMDFEDGVTANFTMTAFTPGGRQVKVMGTKGYLEGGENKLNVYDYNKKAWESCDFASEAGNVSDGHGGGDFGIMESFVDALLNENDGGIRTGAEETLVSHLMTFAAEKARIDNKVVELDSFIQEIRESI
ncbi:MAG: Gfo/Idh/MocA family protein [Sedimentisphaeraceae bacterium JB056]